MMPLRGALLAWCSGLLAVAGASLAHAAEPEGSALGSLDELVTAAREATAKFRDNATASREGYRKIGPDFPTLGQHWVNVPLLLMGKFDPTRPTVLGYADIAGTPTLVKVAYALPVDAGQTVPDYPWLAGAWRYIAGNMAESGVPGLARMNQAAEPGGFRIAVLHAWVWSHNPGGVLEMHNWTLPFARLGLTAPDDTNADAAHALGLVSGGVDYYRSVLLSVGRPTASDVKAIDALLEDHRQRVSDWVDVDRSVRPVVPDDLAALGAIWRSLQTGILGGVTAETRTRLQSLFTALSTLDTPASP